MNVKAVVIASILLAPLMLINVNAEEVRVDIAEGSSKYENGKYYVPATVTVPVGTTVVWKNLDDASQPHTVTDGTLKTKWGLIFNSGVMRFGDIYEFIFDEPGVYPYLCAFHPWMVGTVIVGHGKTQPVELTVKPAKTTYKAGDTVIINGSVDTPIEGMSVLIEVLNPNNEFIVSEAIFIGGNGEFIYDFELTGNQAIEGTYTVKVSHAGNSAESMFTVQRMGDEEPGSADVRVTARQIKDLILVRFRNVDSSTASVYGINIQLPDPSLEAFRGPRHWSNSDVTSNEATSITDEPLKPGDRAIFRMKVNSNDTLISWTAYGSNNIVLDQGQVKPIG